jgi:O-antigen/teichoic acid export membrane protein
MSVPLSRIIREKNIQSVTTSVFVAAINLAIFVILVRSLGKEAFGKWVIFITAAGLVDLLRFGLTKRALIHYVSAAEKEKFKFYAGSGMAIDAVLALLISILVFATYLLLGDGLGIYKYFFLYYPALCLVSLNWNNATAMQQSLQRFDRILLIRLFLNIPFFLFALINLYYLHVDLDKVILVFLFINLAGSLASGFLKWDGLYCIRHCEQPTVKKIINYGKFTLLTSTGSSLLRSADTLIIGLSPVLGATGVAIYSIPFKVVDLLQTPLNAFVATASPKMSRAFQKNNIGEFKHILFTYTGAVSLMLIPVSIAIVIFSHHILLLFAGQEYLGDFAIMTVILVVILVYGLLIPFDRFTGVALDSAEMPDKNALKVYVMVLLNVTGDFIAVFLFQSLIMVGVISIVFTLVGMLIGWRYLQKKFMLNPFDMFSKGLFFYKKMLSSVRTFN